MEDQGACFEWDKELKDVKESNTPSLADSPLSGIQQKLFNFDKLA
jgi:hypothetical protein